MIALCVPSQDFTEVPAVLHVVNTFDRALFRTKLTDICTIEQDAKAYTNFYTTAYYTYRLSAVHQIT